jgi:4-hydroxythreonine-4-phosphate dehydrogenase
MSLTWIGPDEVLGGAPAADPHVSIGSWDGTSDGAGRVAAVAIERAAKGALRGDFHAVVTAPLHKPSLRSAGWDVPGQTELLQNLAAAPSVGMLMAAETTLAGGALRVLLATTHHALRQVPDLITIELLLAQIRLLDESLKEDWGLPAPRLALCALNPHASDDGLFGSEEASIFTPALDCARAGGVQIDGPLPADTVFRRALMGDFDAVVAPYHDVGMAAFKTVSFGQGVNVTLGLPFIRTSPDHGTAFDIAGSGSADPSSMAAALLMAARLARNRFDTDSASV